MLGNTDVKTCYTLFNLVPLKQSCEAGAPNHMNSIIRENRVKKNDLPKNRSFDLEPGLLTQGFSLQLTYHTQYLKNLLSSFYFSYKIFVFIFPLS